MTRLLEPSEVFHAFLDWQTGFEVETRAPVTPATVAAALDGLYAAFPRLASRIVRTPEGFVFEPAPPPAVETTGGGARAAAALSAFAVDGSRPGATVVSGRLHHALCDVTGILSMADHLLGLLGVLAGEDSLPARFAREWPIAAETVLGAPGSADATREIRTFFSGLSSPSLNPARPVHLRLPADQVRAVDDACAAESTSLTAVIAAAAAPYAPGETDRVVVGVPVDCRVYIDPGRVERVPPRAIGNCSHGALVSVPRSTRTPAQVLAVARDCDAELLDQLEEQVPAAPFRDGRLYLPEHNAAQLVVSNARGAARRFPRLAEASRVTLLPEVSVPALPMIAVNEDPATRAVVITLIADPADYTPDGASRLADALASTLSAIGERR